MRGTIVKGIAGFYYVRHEGSVYQCKARGLFKKDDIKPMVGDSVEFEHGPGEDDDGWITEILPRRNSFIRPPIANVDCFVIVVAAAHPKPNPDVMDKFLVMAEKSGTDIIVCINKTDLAKSDTIERLKAIYDPIYPVVCLSGTENSGIDELRNLLTSPQLMGTQDDVHAAEMQNNGSVEKLQSNGQVSGRHVALAGPSGVGKSTLLNCLIPEAAAETGIISHKSKRGKHTTRHSELFPLESCVMIFDTPGFTSFDILEADEEELQYLYPEMAPFIGHCKYDNCRHVKEPDCAVRSAAEEGRISQQRYESYVTQLKEIQEKNRY